MNRRTFLGLLPKVSIGAALAKALEAKPPVLEVRNVFVPGWRPGPKQAAALARTDRAVSFGGGRRCGVTETLLAWMAIENAKDMIPGNHLVLASTHEHAMRMRERYLELANLISPIPAGRAINRPTFVVHGQALVEFRSLLDWLPRGIGYRRVVVDDPIYSRYKISYYWDWLNREEPSWGGFRWSASGADAHLGTYRDNPGLSERERFHIEERFWR